MKTSSKPNSHIISVCCDAVGRGISVAATIAVLVVGVAVGVVAAATAVVAVVDRPAY